MIDLFVTSGTQIRRASLQDAGFETVTTIDVIVVLQPIEVWPVRDGIVVFVPPAHLAGERYAAYVPDRRTLYVTELRVETPRDRLAAS